ncbi:MAG: hypothetical protein DLM57_06510 [Pseudonocardiales bacterium]|nr:MAG: hypothetical protein DLM57_06510 [Pseudonocardiales bacterium]
MSAPVPHVGVQPGDGLVARFGTAVLVADTSGDQEAFTNALLATLEPASIETAGPSSADLAWQLAGLLGSHQGTAAAFGVAISTSDGYLVLLHGAVRALVSAADGDVELTGRGALTWVDHVVSGPVNSISITLAEHGTVDVDRRYDLRGGLVPGRGLVLTTTAGDGAAPQQPAEAAAPAAEPDLPSDASEPSPEAGSETGPGWSGEPWVVAAEPPGGTDGPTEPWAVAAEHPDETDGPADSGTEAAAAEHPDETDGPTEPWAVAAEHPDETDGPTGPTERAAAAEGATAFVPDPATAEPVPAADLDMPPEPALVVPSEQDPAVITDLPTSRNPRAPVDEAVPAEGSAGALVSDDGARTPLDRSYVFGREPQHEASVVSGAASPIHLKDPDNLISRVQTYVSVDADGVTVRDASSSNGTFLAAPGAEEWIRLGEEPVALPVGWSIRMGRRVFTHLHGM